MASKSETSAREFAARAEKAQRWAGYFFKHGVPASVVTHMGLNAPEWKQLATAITAESGRKLIEPHSQATVDAIVRNLVEMGS